MAQSQKRYDGYGRPVPTLTEAREESFYERPQNTHMRKMIRAQLETQYLALLKRGVQAVVMVTFRIKEGVILEEFTVTIGHELRCEREGE